MALTYEQFKGELDNERPFRLDESPDGIYFVDGRRVSADVYFENFGKEIDEHPILNPRRILG